MGVIKSKENGSMENNYYESVLDKGIKLNSCVMVHNAYWSYFRKLDSHYSEVAIHTFGGDKFYFDSAVRNYPETYRYENYDLFLLSSNDYFAENSLEELKQLAMKMSENKRITIGYDYPVENQGCNSYVIESYFNGIKDFSIEGKLEKYVINSIQTINLMAEKHMELISKNKQECDDNLSLELNLNIKDKN